MTATIVVGVDGSPGSVAALGWAAAEARFRRSNLRLMYALQVPLTVRSFGESDAVQPTAALRERAECALVEARHRLAFQAPRVQVETSVALRPALDALALASHDAELVVVGTHRFGVLGGRAFGSVGGRLAARACCPVVVVPAGWVSPDHGSIVVGVDGSAHGDAALRFALAEAVHRSAGVVAVRAYHVTLPGAIDNPYAYRKAAEREHRCAEDLAQEAVERALAVTGLVVPVVARAAVGRPADVMIAASRGAELLVVGCRGRGPLHNLLLRSDGQGVLRRATRPVAVVRADSAS
ncbi:MULTISPECIES: universal stress protein [Nocardiopsidaceae]|uniref:Nucleotide-binding universal stress UspA family protein n=3 Tax=Nocardiopsidaceae TaxID=83676 RepID=A0A840WB59_9ACTN|nr:MULTISPECIES: universal stress protein [Nocardiopsaceae]MBB5493394.1 nucleotide-binding universal stress UspA family protein [Nocardiopsis metallicus]MCK9874179.1 universal stress protein [Nocardiopsis dassonvillei]MEE2051608.1 universal stress protein [Nocardiopsis umidischolae]PSK87510.1 nucleotide-binding universal stress UspA family protein [Murinocardiopsis flavida]